MWIVNKSKRTKLSQLCGMILFENKRNSAALGHENRVTVVLEIVG
jgi:hypothetical protein